jgi:DNA helicase-2/ATP-dependent DNA helicase PcrA
MIALSPVQQRIVDHGDGALLVLAGPGSGKTRVLTERVRRLLTVSQGHFRVLALTFTNKAANEMRERLSELPDINERAFIGTFHSFCVEVLASRGAAIGLEVMPHLFESIRDRSQILLESAIGDPLLAPEVLGRDQKDRSQLIGRWLDEISYAKSNLMSSSEVDDPVIRRVYEVYDDGLRSCGALDFDDLLLLVHRLFVERPRIADFFRRQFRYICIDEAQDMNPAQFYLLAALCGDEYRNVMMVGDPRQAIFSWNGADVRFLDTFRETFGARVEQLTENYRSCQAVVRAAQALAPGYAVEGRLPIRGEVRLLVSEDESDEANQVLSAIADVVDRGHPDVEGPMTFERCAVIGRTRFALGAIEGRLKEARLPYHKQLSAQHESESSVLQDFEVALRVVSNPRDRLHLAWLANRWSSSSVLPASPPRPDEVIPLLEQLTREEAHRAVVDAMRRMGSPSAVRIAEALDSLTSFADALAAPEERALLLQDIAVWRSHWDGFLRSSRGGDHSLAAFLSGVALGATQRSQSGGLALLTVHSAKGLEFELVAVVGLVDGVFPDFRARGKALDEENRNAFVAVTRAKRILLLSRPRSRMMPWGESRAQRPSPYFDAVSRALGQ